MINDDSIGLISRRLVEWSEFSDRHRETSLAVIARDLEDSSTPNVNDEGLLSLPIIGFTFHRDHIGHEPKEDEPFSAGSFRDWSVRKAKNVDLSEKVKLSPIDWIRCCAEEDIKRDLFRINWPFDRQVFELLPIESFLIVIFPSIKTMRSLQIESNVLHLPSISDLPTTNGHFTTLELHLQSCYWAAKRL